jgi:SET domain-containing protein
MTEIEYALRDLGLTMEQLEYLTEQGEVLEFQIDRVEKRQSDIHGYGMFAIEDIPAQTLIGLGSVNYKYKTLLGRYTNHSINPNCLFVYLANNDVVMISLRDISSGEELLIDYRDHLLNPQYL